MSRAVGIRAGSRWVHKKTKRLAVVSALDGNVVEYKYAWPARRRSIYEYMTPEPYARRTRAGRRSFLKLFERAGKGPHYRPI